MKNHEINKKREISDAIKQAIREMSDVTKQAIRDMPVHFENERTRDDYIIANADKFVTQYKTNKTDIREEWPNIEDARKAARFAATVSAKTGKSPAGRGIYVIAMMGVYDAVVEQHSGKTLDVEGSINGKDTK